MAKWTIASEGPNLNYRQTVTRNDGDTLSILSEGPDLLALMPDGWSELQIEKALGQIMLGRGTVKFEPYSEIVTIAPATGQADSQGDEFSIPSSTEHNRTFVFLRPGDRVKYGPDDPTISFYRDVEPSPPSPALQVKSSEPLPMLRDESQATGAEPFSTAQSAQVLVQETPITDRHVDVLRSNHEVDDSTAQIDEPSASPLESRHPINGPRSQLQHRRRLSSEAQASEDHHDVQVDDQSTSPVESRPAKRRRLPSSFQTSPEEVDPTSSGERKASDTSSSQSRRSSVNEAQSSPKDDKYKGSPPRMLLSNTDIESRPRLMKFLKAQDVVKTDNLDKQGSNFVCVGNGELKTTAKLLMGLVLDKVIVTDKWVVDSQKAGHLLDTKRYIPEALYSTHPLTRSDLFGGKPIFITQALKKQYAGGLSDMQKIVKHAGASEFSAKSARDIRDGTDAILVGLPQDNDAASLIKRGLIVYKKELIAAMIIGAESLLKDEAFMMQPADS